MISRLVAGLPVRTIVVSRLIVLAAAALAESALPRDPLLTSGDPAPLLASLTSWDGWWYLAIARDGYHAEPLMGAYRDVAFFPLYPALVRALAAPWPAFTGLVAVLASNVLFVVALCLLVALGDRVVGEGRSRSAAGLLALSPFAASFSMAYSESLFLVLALGAFLAAERDRRPTAGILLGLAALSRANGALLALPVCLLLLARDGRPRRSLGWVLLGPAAAVGYLGWVGSLGGSVFAYGAAQAAWGRVGPSVTPAGGSLGASFDQLGPLLGGYQLALLATLLVGVFLLVYLRPDRIPRPYALLPLLGIGSVLASGIIESVGRYLTVAFPYAWVLAGRRAVLVRRALPIASGALLFLVSTAVFTGGWVP